MPGTDKRKQLLYLPEDMLLEIMREANRLDRSLSWTVQRAWLIARADVQKFPAANPQGSISAPSQAAARIASPQPASEPASSGSEPRRAASELERARADADLREFLRGKFDRNVPL